MGLQLGFWQSPLQEADQRLPGSQPAAQKSGDFHGFSPPKNAGSLGGENDQLWHFGFLVHIFRESMTKPPFAWCVLFLSTEVQPMSNPSKPPSVGSTQMGSACDCSGLDQMINDDKRSLSCVFGYDMVR